MIEAQAALIGLWSGSSSKVGGRRSPFIVRFTDMILIGGIARSSFRFSTLADAPAFYVHPNLVVNAILGLVCFSKRRKKVNEAAFNGPS